MVSAITAFRDQLFGHLDKVCVLSDGRIDLAIIMS